MENFEVSPNEPFTLEGVTVSIEQDNLGWELMGDEPVNVFGLGRYASFWNIHAGGASVPRFETLVMIHNEEWQEIVESACYDCEERATAIVVYPDWHDHAITFKNWENAAKGMLRRQGVDLDDVKIVKVSARYHQTSDSYYVVWSQSQMDEYAGVKNAHVSTEYYESILSGDVWCISVDDEDSCGGFVGEYWSEHVQSEARAMFEHVLDEKRKARALEIESTRPDLYACT